MSTRELERAARRTKEERKFLQGPQARGSELLRAVRIFLEFMGAFRRLHFVGPCVTVFGSARFPEDHRYYALARETGRLLSEAGFTVMTGGGPGVMEAANRGAKDAGGHSIGATIHLPFEQGTNPYLDTVVDFNYFFVRKVILLKYSYAFVVMPGGFGTLDEVFETATLVQTEKIRHFPIVLMDSEFWQPMIDALRAAPLREGTLDGRDLDLLQVIDSPAEAVEQIVATAMERFDLKYGPRPKRHWFFGERG